MHCRKIMAQEDRELWKHKSSRYSIGFYEYVGLLEDCLLAEGHLSREIILEPYIGNYGLLYCEHCNHVFTKPISGLERRLNQDNKD